MRSEVGAEADCTKLIDSIHENLVIVDCRNDDVIIPALQSPSPRSALILT